MRRSALSPGLRPDGRSLDVVLSVWAAEDSGTFAAPGVDGSARLVGGEPVDDASLVWLATALCRPGLRFVAVRDPQPAGPIRLGATLLEAGRRLRDQGGLRGLERRQVVSGRHRDALPRLPLRPVSRRALRAALASSQPLGDAIAAEGLSLAMVEEDIAALLRLGFLQLRHGGGEAGQGNRAPRARRALATRRLHARLTRDLETMEDADHWQVLGLPRDAGPDLVARGAARMRRRYAGVDEDVGDPGSKDAVRRVRARVEAAISHLQHEPADVGAGAGGSQPAANSAPSAARALRLGQAAAARGALGEARRWLSAAHRQDGGDPEIQAWYAWALAADPAVQHDRAARRAAGLLVDARHHAPGDPGVRARCAAAALELGDVAAAAQDLEVLARIAPEHGDLPRLWHRLERGRG